MLKSTLSNLTEWLIYMNTDVLTAECKELREQPKTEGGQRTLEHKSNQSIKSQINLYCRKITRQSLESNQETLVQFGIL